MLPRTVRVMSLDAYTVRRPGRSRFIDVRGLRYHVLEWGDATMASAERPPLVMLHGWMDVAASFQFVVDALSSDRYVIALDWRGFGLTESPGADTYWMPDYLGDLDAALDQLLFVGATAERKIDLLGHSMGGNVVMSYAGVRPARVRRLINLEGFGLPASHPQDAAPRLLKWLDELKAPARFRPYANAGEVAARLVKTNPRLSPDKAAWLATRWAAPDANGHWHLLADAAHRRINPALYQADEIVETWARISAPLLWIEGADTDIAKWWNNRYPRSEFEARLARVPQVQTERFADCGHMLHHDRPDALAARLSAFLR